MQPYWTRLYWAHLIEQKELAFMRWRSSGYRDVAAWQEFVAAFEKLSRGR